MSCSRAKEVEPAPKTATLLPYNPSHPRMVSPGSQPDHSGHSIPVNAMQFNQFLIMDDEPFLMHTGFKSMFPITLEAVSSIINPSNIRWIGFSHFESDECGALNEFLKVAPYAQAVCSVVGAMVNVGDFACRAPRPLADGEALQTGRHRLRFVSTLQVPHCWDAGLFF